MKYTVLRKAWEAGKKGAPNNHCLAIARDFYCYQSFPECESNDTIETALCEHTCATWLERCPFEDQSICDSPSSSESCTFARDGISTVFSGSLLATAVIMYTLA